MQKINKIQALKQIKEGKTVYVLPSNVGLGNTWITPFAINIELLETFYKNGESDSIESQYKRFVNACKYYNCNSQTGMTLTYYNFGG